MVYYPLVQCLPSQNFDDLKLKGMKTNCSYYWFFVAYSSLHLLLFFFTSLLECFALSHLLIKTHLNVLLFVIIVVNLKCFFPTQFWHPEIQYSLVLSSNNTHFPFADHDYLSLYILLLQLLCVNQWFDCSCRILTLTFEISSKNAHFVSLRLNKILTF